MYCPDAKEFAEKFEDQCQSEVHKHGKFPCSNSFECREPHSYCFIEQERYLFIENQQKVHMSLKAYHPNDYKLIVSMVFQSYFINILEMLHLAFSFAGRLTTLQLFLQLFEAKTKL